MPGALDGYRIVDASQVVSGPIATRILADQGADVIKIEPHHGDLTRHLGGGRRGLSPLFAAANRSKRSVALDLKHPAGVDALKRIVAGADVFVQNFRPGAVEGMGIDAAALREVRPDLVYVSISGFGESGPYTHKRVYDPVVQALSGLASIQGGVKGPPRLVRLIVPDKVTALTASQMITAALLARERTGKGQHVRLAMLDAMLAFLWPEAMAYHTYIGEDVEGVSPPDRRELIFETRDGYMAAGTVAHREWVGFCRAAERPEWLDDPRFRNAAGLVKHAEARLDLMAEVLKTRTTAEWLERLDRAEVPCAPVLTRDELLTHPQILANDLIREIEHPRAGRMRQIRPAERMEGTPSVVRCPAPDLGQHTEEVLREAGFSAREIQTLRSDGVVA